MAPRKHNTLSLGDKVKIIKLIQGGQSYDTISKTFNIGKSTVGDIKKNMGNILKFVSTTEGGPKERKTLKTSDNVELENAVYLWFLQQRRLHVPLSGDMICEKAILFHRQLTGNEGFVASKGWLDRFKHRHGIRRLKMTGEKLSSNEGAIEPYREELLSVIADKHLSPEQIYNADESGLFWRMLPDRTLAAHNEKMAPGRKMIKARITFMPCANMTGKHKLPLFVVGTAQKPRAFKAVTLPIYYRGQKSAWVTRDLFLEWFKCEFVPAVRQHLRSINLPERALLLLDNCPGHPSADELVSDDGEFRAMFLPPNTTALIQPMDQNVIQNIKLRYRKSLLTNILADPAYEDNILNALKKINLKDVVFSLAICWSQVSLDLINKSWKNLLPNLIENDAEESHHAQIQLAPLLNQLHKDDQITDAEVQEWVAEADVSLARNEVLTDEEILKTVTADEEDDDDDSTSQSSNKIPHSEAVGALNTSLQWAEEQNFDAHEIMLLRRMRDRAYELKIDSSCQKKITDFFVK